MKASMSEVAALRKAIAAGTYDADAHQVAAAIVRRLTRVASFKHLAQRGR
jgi:anti-sigma28 factor (negative regulator of flagellin synthesis)